MNELEERNELRDNPIDKMGQLMQKWNDRLTLDNLRFSERYVNHGLRIHIHFRTCHEGYYSGEFCAALQHWGVGKNMPVCSGHRRPLPILFSEGDFKGRVEQPSQEQESV